MSATTFNGYLFSKLANIGSKQEGPVYQLQQFDYKEHVVIKKVENWKQDPVLHPFLNKKVTIEGSQAISGIDYRKIRDWKTAEDKDEESLILDLELGSDVLWVNKMLPGPNPPQSFDLTLLVKWPYRSVWEGQCPTTQIYDFWIEYGKETIWRWSDGKFFAQVVTPVTIPGGDFHRFPEVWSFKPETIEHEGSYVARALFVASGQVVSRDFKVKFAQ